MQFAGDLNLIKKKKNMNVSEIRACHEIAVSFNKNSENLCSQRCQND